MTLTSEATRNSQIRVYDPAVSVVFLKTNERFGGLSNMAPGFPLRINGIPIRTSEALYQACRFPHMPDVQRRILDEHSPMTAKMRTKPFRSQSRPDWDNVRVKIMRWCLRVKLAQNWHTFSELLLATEDRPIVEQSRKDDFWGAKVTKNGTLVGMNVLGRLLMELREQLKSEDPESLKIVEPPPIPEFMLFQKPIEPVYAGRSAFNFGEGEDQKHRPNSPPIQRDLMQTSLFEQPESSQDQITNREERLGSTIKSEKLQPYPEYKDSGQPFLGKIPAHWNLFRNGRLFSQRNETGFGELPILEVSLKTGVRVRDMDNLKRKQVMSDREKYKRAAQGDIAYNMMRMWQGAVGVAPVDGLVSPAYVVVRPLPDVDCHYFSYLFRTASYMNEVDAYSRGIVKDRNRLYWQDFKRMPSLVPPIEEQRHITRFLEAVGSKVQRFIRNKRRLIDLLKEQKQNVINQAVTRGLDPKVKFKPSGVEWIGDIPEHWEARRLRTLAAVRASGVDKNTNEDEVPVMLCNYVDVYKNDRITAAIDFMKATATLEEIRAFELKAGDVIITKDSESWDDIAIPTFVPEALPGVVCAYHLALIRPFSGEIEGEFLFRAFSSDPVADQFRIAATGVTRFGLAQGAIKGAFFPLPPLEEQRVIIAHINEKCAEISQAISRAEREIELMREYHTRLISDVVTGQVDVSGIEVPEVAEEELMALEEDTADDVIDGEGDMDETD
ncbi:NADAR domain-containing protein [Marinobacterium litorale]|uniref:NADAR domain-containing protein n=1 Tax=Marinobacterium litorale TaxID=404770 RepID=UPI001B7FDA8D|nr:NADAR domain-containing protein [Marinobacterium litorale]